jgi:hypothetical protein
MLQDIFSSKAIFGALFCCVLIVTGSLLYSWHVQRSSCEEVERTQRFLQQLGVNKDPRAGQDTGIPTDIGGLDTSETSLETDTTQAMSEATQTLLIDDTEHFDDADTFVADDIVFAEEESAEVPVSPFGFGPYPEVPAGFPRTPVWLWPAEKRQEYADAGRLIDFELMHRVLIKLYNQGDRGWSGVKRDDKNGKVYPLVLRPHLCKPLG